MVWMVESQIHQQYSCSLCSTVHLQYVRTTDANSTRPKEKGQFSFRNLCMYSAWVIKLSKKIFTHMRWLRLALECYTAQLIPNTPLELGWHLDVFQQG